MVTGNLKAPLLLAEVAIREQVLQAGAEAAPTPHELIEAALATCTILTVQMYAQRKGWPLTHIRSKVQFEPTGQIRREVEFKGSLSDEQRARLMDIAGKCPIHKLLSKANTIITVEVAT